MINKTKYNNNKYRFINSILYQNLISKASLVIVIAVAFLLPFHIYIVKLPCLIALFWILEGKYKNKFIANNGKEKRIVLGVLIAFFIYILFSESLHSGLNYGINEAFKKLGMFIFPIIFFASNSLFHKSKSIKIILFAFVLGSFLLSCYVIYSAKIIYPTNSSFPVFLFVRNSFTGSYLRFSIYPVFASTVAFYLLYNSNYQKKYIFAYLISFIVFATTIYIAGARTGLISFVLTLGIIGCLMFNKLRDKVILKYFLLFILFVMASLILYNSDRLKRNIYKSPRTHIYLGSIYTIKNNLNTPKSFLFGLGKKQGYQDLAVNIKQRRIGRKSTLSPYCYTYLSNFHSHPHNDFFSIIIKRGFFGFLFIISVTATLLMKFRKNKNILFLFFFIVFGLYAGLSGLFENTQDTYFFYFFYSMFMFLDLKNENFKVY